jgi:hypothetical protein
MTIDQKIEAVGAVAGALATLLATLRNLFVLFGKLPKAQGVLGKLADRLSWVAEHAKGGLFGTPVSLPGLGTRKPDEPSKAPGALLALLALLAAGAMLASGCATTAAPKGATFSQKLSADAALIEKCVNDVKTKCGPQYAPLAPVFTSILSVAANPTDAFSDLMAVVAAYPVVVQDAKALACAWSTIRDDLKAAGMKAQADVADQVLVALGNLEGLAPGELLACAGPSR